MGQRDRSGGGRRGPSGERRSPYGRRTPPPESTGKEAEYVLRMKEAETPLTVHLVDGETVRGVIEYYDRAMIKIVRDDGPGLFIRKDRIRYMFADED